MGKLILPIDLSKFLVTEVLCLLKIFKLNLFFTNNFKNFFYYLKIMKIFF